MKTVLIVAYYYSPSVDAGSKRAEGFARYLPDHGYEPIVITVADGNYSVPLDAPTGTTAIHTNLIRVPTRGRKQPRGTAPPATRSLANRALRRLYRELFYIPDGFRPFLSGALREAEQVIRKRTVDIGLCTSSPYTALQVGYRLHHSTGLPWVADLRDLWTANHHSYPFSPLRRRLDQFLERRWLSTAAGVTTATEGLRNVMIDSGWVGAPITCVHNGFIDEPPVLQPDPAAPLTIRFTGKLYEQRGHSIRPLLEAVRVLERSRPDAAAGLRIEFFGHVNSDFSASIQQFGYGDRVIARGLVSRDQAIRAQASSDILLVLIPDEPRYRVVVPSKVYEYLPTRKPILSIAPTDGEAAEILRRTGSGHTFGETQHAEIADYLLRMFETKRKRGALPQVGNRAEIDSFHYSNLAGRLAAFFDELLSNRAHDKRL